MSDDWLKEGNAWETRKANKAEIVKFGGEVKVDYINDHLTFTHVNYEPVLAVPYDTPIVGYKNDIVNTLRLWSAEAVSNEFDFSSFSRGDFLQAIEYKNSVESISQVLYPEDSFYKGKILRLKQEYFFVSAGVQSIVRHFKKHGGRVEELDEKIAIHINDTHPTLAIPELMRILVDEEGLPWEDAWRVTTNTVSYTNHTILAEALEKWPIDMFKSLLPRIYMIIEEINRANVAAVFGDIFQLLDRKESNESRYPINIPQDMKNYLEKYDIYDEKLKIPSNFYIWATMNSADQGVFPMDTAFKRRWDFKYLGINHGEEEIENTYVVLNGEKISWNKLRKAINNQLLTEKYRINEDKLLGPFFAFNEYLNREIPVDVFKETFKNKILMYLFEDAARPRRNELFEGARGDKTNITYSEICEEFDKNDVGLGIFKFIIISDISVDEED